VPASPAVTESELPLLTFVFDDGNETDYSVAKSIFEAEGAVACSAIITDRIDQPGFLQAGQVVELQSAGWEILSHTVTHRRLNNLTEARLEFELEQSKTRLESLGARVHNLVYPMNMNNERVRAVARKYYRSSRGGANRFNTGTTDPYWLKAFRNGPRLDDMKALVDRAHAERRWLILYHHNIDVRLELAHQRGQFARGEELEFAPSGARGMFSSSRWLWMLDGYHFVPTSGRPAPGDHVRGLQSGATAETRSVTSPAGDELRELLRYVHARYPDLRIVTIDQGLDVLEHRSWGPGLAQGSAVELNPGQRPGG
jgi:peptidoglycan/xylan/chitin deacetylase (PgdA/CDA1 family)